MSIRKRESKKAKNGYTYQVYFYYRDKFDKRQRYSKGGFLTKKEAQIHENQVKNELEEKGSINKNKDLPFSKVFEEFLKDDGHLFSPNTINVFKSKYNKYLKNNIGQARIVKVYDYEYLQCLFNSLKGVSYDVTKQIKATLFNVMKYATRKGYITPINLDMINIQGVRKERKKRKIVSYELFLQACNEVKPHQAILLAIAYYTGMRVAEICALKREDIDFENNTIDINKQLVYASRNTKQYEIKDILKTSKSKAKIPLTNELKRILKDYIEQYPYDPICSKKGKFFDVMNFDRILKKKYGFTYHDLRHTFTTNLINHGVDIKTAQELLRHTNYNITLSLYTHVDESKKLSAVNDVFNIKSAENVPKIEKLN